MDTARAGSGKQERTMEPFTKTVTKRIWVEVDPARSYWDAKGEKDEENCESIAIQIRRHVDGIQGVVVRREVVTLCMYCNDTPDCSEDGCPNCCDKAIEHWQSAQA